MKRKIFLSLFSGLTLSLGFLPFRFFWIFSWFGFLPLFFALAKANSKLKAFFLSYVAGILFWLITIYWLIHVTLVGLILLIIYLGLYFGIWGVFFYIFFKKKIFDIFFIPSIWVILEYIREKLFTGFGWAILGYSQSLNPTLIQIADLFGAESVSFLIMAINLTIFIGFFNLSPKRIKVISVGLIMLFFSLLYGNYKKFAVKNFYSLGVPFKVALIQANIPQSLKWDPFYKDFILQRYLTLTKQVIKENPDLIIWPEASLPVVIEEEPIYYLKVLDFVKETKKALLLGLVTKEDTLYYNCAEFISPDAKPLMRYRKLHLVPFGEYIPLKKIFHFLEDITPIGNFSKGKEYTLFEINKDLNLFKFSVLICFEDIFPELSYRFVKRGADFLVNITNDAWFKESPASFQHLTASIFRAVENRRYIIRSANTGISCFISPTGEIINKIKDPLGKDIFIEGVLSQNIFLRKIDYLSFYTRYPGLFIIGCSIIVFYGIWREKKR